MPDPVVAAMLDAYEAQLRAHVSPRLPEGVLVERDGPLVRYAGYGERGFVGYRDLAGLDGSELDELIARQVRIFRDRGEPFEWKLHAHDQPPDLAERLRAAGFVPEDEETVVIAPVAAVALEPSVPEDVRLREVHARADLDEIVRMEEAIWNDDSSSLADSLERDLAADRDGLTIIVAESDDLVVCAGWARFPEGTEFATLWGGGTLTEWRRRGIYRAVVAYRAKLAERRGLRYLQVDSSGDSRPILERLGFVAVTTTTPYIWSPSA